MQICIIFPFILNFKPGQQYQNSNNDYNEL